MASISNPLQFKRLYSGSLDDSEVHASYEEALEYAKSPSAYPGQKLSVKSETGEYIVYIINEDRTLSNVSIPLELLDYFIWHEINE